MIEPQRATLAQRRPFQYSLRSIFGLTVGTAAFFSLARTLGYADAVVSLIAIAILVVVMEYPRLVRLPTGVILTIVAGTLLWANLRPTGWEREFGLPPPAELDAFAQSMFYRGWPVVPVMLCPVRGMEFRSSGGEAYVALFADGVFLAVSLVIARVICEWFLRRRDKSIVEASPDAPKSGN